MKWNSLFSSIHFPLILAALFLLGSIPKNASAQTILNPGDETVFFDSDGASMLGRFPAGDATFNLTAADIPNVELLADFFLVDAGVDIVINGTSLFPQFDDISQFGPTIFPGTGATLGGDNIDFPFNTNANGLPRLTVSSTSAGTTFSGAIFENSTTTTPLTPNFAVQDFTSLLVPGANTIEIFNLNQVDGAALEGEFVVSLAALDPAAVPEPSSISILLLLGTCLVTKRRR